MAKRGSRRPESKSTRPPARPKSSFPRKDPRPPKRGKKAGAPTPSPLVAAVEKHKAGLPPGATKLDGHMAPSSPVVKQPKRRTPAPENQEQQVPRKLSDAQIAEREHRLYTLYRRKREIEREKKRVTADLSRDITALCKEADKLAEEIERRYELVGQGELRFDEAPAPKVDNPPPAAAAVAGSVVAKAAAVADSASGRQVCSWCVEKRKADPTFALADGFFVDGRARIVCKPCHESCGVAEKWPTPGRVDQKPERCPSCSASMAAIKSHVYGPASEMALFACNSAGCSWTAIMGKIPELPQRAPKVGGNGKTNGDAFAFDGTDPAPTISATIPLAKTEPVVEARP